MCYLDLDTAATLSRDYDSAQWSPTVLHPQLLTGHQSQL